MKPPHFSTRWAKGTYRGVGVAVRVLCLLAILSVAAFVYLRIYGVPKPLLQKVVGRINAAGIPVEIENITLTLKGWRADRVKYYSRNPDDLEPMFDIDQVYFDAQSEASAAGPVFNVLAQGIWLNPSVEWGVDLPPESPARHIEEAEVVLSFQPDQVEIKEGSLRWMAGHFRVDGTILKNKGRAKKKPAPQDTVSPVRLTAERFQQLEARLKALSMSGEVEVDIGFLIDMNDYASSRLDFSIQSEGLEWRGIPFSRVDIAGSYAYPKLDLQRAALFQEKLSAQLEGKYNLETKIVEGSFSNTLQSRQLLLLVPEQASGLLVEKDIRLEELPRVELDFGPAPLTNVLSQISGSFAVRNASYKNITAEMLRGTVERQNGRLDFKDLHVVILGREAEADRIGSGMRGGSAEGHLFWDAREREFGMEFEGGLDPNLLAEALSPSKVANKVIRRFRFKEQPPHVRVDIGFNSGENRDFHIHVDASGNDVEYEGVMCDSLNVIAFYQNGKLNLDPVSVMQGSRFARGSALIDFRNDIVSFDGSTTLNPRDIEDMIHPDFNLFGNRINVSGNVQVDAAGTFDWGSMLETDFRATVAVDRCEVQVAAIDGFTAEVVGKGSLLHVKDSTFGMYGGRGTADMKIHLASAGMPYELTLQISDAKLKQCLAYISPNKKSKVTGIMNAMANVTSDFSTNFLCHAKGTGSIQVAKGQLADLPLLKEFSSLIRKILPGFSVFSITSLSGDVMFADGKVMSENVYFGGEIINARGRGHYSADKGFNAYIQAEILKDGGLSKVVHVITNPLMKFLEIRLEGPLDDPSWRLQKFPVGIANLFRRKKD